MANLSSILFSLIYTLPSILIALVCHEFAHGLVSYKLGDPTPKYEGRLSLNPIRHIDPLGAIFLIIFNFGWAKPVMVNPQYYKKPKQGMALVAAAGPTANFLLSFLAYCVMAVMEKSSSFIMWAGAPYFYQSFQIFAMINIGLGIFNLLPFPPLDGSKIFGAILPRDLYFGYMRFEQYGMIILMLLLFTGVLSKPLYVMRRGVVEAMTHLAQSITFFL